MKKLKKLVKKLDKEYKKKVPDEYTISYLTMMIKFKVSDL